MESNGSPGKIHLSQQTADRLLIEGLGHWIVPRKEVIEAKGKGRMQTYWMQVKQLNKKDDRSKTSEQAGGSKSSRSSR